ncbi:MAG: dihydropteroate synthase [Acidobacteriota bacterium]|jgi:dihydropteroate synthase|nr:dihydropteroate synthase [Acidobacteriota bacterium]
MRQWKIARRTLSFGERTLVMGVLNVTPDSFSDGGQFLSADRAVARAGEMIAEGADIIDVGGESTRPAGAQLVSAEEELRRVMPVIERLAKNSTVPISIDTTKAKVAHAALDAGAEIVNDISGLRFDPTLADEAARVRAGLVLMHSRGDLTTMHRLEPVADIFAEVETSLRRSIAEAEGRGVSRECIAVDPGIGFSKSQEQNLELIARLNEFAQAFSGFPILVGTSRKSFLGRLLDNAPTNGRLHGTMATVTAAVLRGAHIVRVHDVKAAVETVRVADAIKSMSAREATV